MKILATLLVCCCFALNGFAQMDVFVPDTTAIIVEQYVNVFKDPRLDALNKRAPLMAKLELEEKAAKDREPVNFKPLVTQDGKKKVTGTIYTAKGFRVVIFSGPDRNLAMQAKNNFTRAYENIPSFVSYNVPSYKIKVGNFETRNAANEFLRKIGKAYPASFIVPDIITIKNINVTN